MPLSFASHEPVSVVGPQAMLPLQKTRQSKSGNFDVWRKIFQASCPKSAWIARFVSGIAHLNPSPPIIVETCLFQSSFAIYQDRSRKILLQQKEESTKKKNWESIQTVSRW
jgi:hypothetical protein